MFMILVSDLCVPVYLVEYQSNNNQDMLNNDWSTKIMIKYTIKEQ